MRFIMSPLEHCSNQNKCYIIKLHIPILLISKSPQWKEIYANNTQKRPQIEEIASWAKMLKVAGLHTPLGKVTPQNHGPSQQN